ncbi:RNA polymerase II elongation factor ELL-like [Amphibalanus amphitrite]|uniref:RNA polymerase II elongation factor ELL-like n=1 Tax=Amphibalanus amphitrite TaxID=1232801 RepID=UPI001C9194D0|nr:RNA polymerase II elongation factor ELL-like [Amphibalanus amphitrite]
MAVLVDGRQYGLSSQGNLTDNKSYLFVKLTDSALKAIEDHVRTGGRSSINFDKNGGKIAFDGGAQFKFSISANPDQGSFECLQQNGSRLESLGAMAHKVRVQANDDVYETTRQRMAEVEEASMKNCTRMIKQGDPFIGRRVKVKAGPGRPVAPAGRRPDPLPHRSPTMQPRQPPASAPPPPSAPGRPAALSGRPGAPAGRPAPGTAPGRPATASAGGGGGGPASSDVMRRPLKERLAHLLATRPRKKVEVMQKLYKDGIREKDKKNVHGLLGSVATLRDNVYYLKRHCWNDVSQDWPFYTEQERRDFAAHRPENLTPPSSDSSSGRSPAGKRPSPSGADPPAGSAAAAAAAKRQRVSHYKRPGEAAPGPGRPRAADAAGSERRNTGPQYDWNKTAAQSPSSTGVSDRTPTPDSSPDSRHSGSSATREEEPDYVSQYVPITSEQQLQRYKADFEAGYAEYQRLWELVGTVYRKFADLEQQLRAAEEGSEQWRGIERAIRDEYEACNNEEYKAARRRWFYLQNKLQYVKALVRRWQAER